MKIIKSSKQCKKRSIKANRSDSLTICPSCGGDQFNDVRGLCLDCGYDEKSWGTGPYYDVEYEDDFDDYDHDYQPDSEYVQSGVVTGLVYWYFTTHGVQPGSIPPSVNNIYDVVDTPNGSYFATDTMFNTKELHEYDLKEKWLPDEYKDKSVYASQRRKVSCSGTSSDYDHREVVYSDGHEYAVRYASIDNGPDADPQKMFRDFKFQISTLAHYDDADYAWCIGKQGVVKTYIGNKLINKTYYFDADDMDVENTDWCDQVINDCVKILDQYNHSIEPKMVYNSTRQNCNHTTIETASNSMIKNLNDELYSAASKYLQDNFDWNLKDIADMLVINVGKVDDEQYRVEVRSELDYDELFDLVKTLDPIVEQYDPDAYFDMVEPGIAEAFIRTNVEACSNVSASDDTKKTNVYITHYGAFDNGHVLHDSKRMTEKEAQEAARQASIKDPTDAYYVHYGDDWMNTTSGIVWVDGVPYHERDVRPYGNGIIIEEDAEPVDMNIYSATNIGNKYCTKFKIKAYTFDETEDGWGEDVEDILSAAFARAKDLMYEVNNTVRGGYTDCETVEDLADFIRQLASEFEEAADEIESL